jgi:hypothetical protein
VKLLLRVLGLLVGLIYRLLVLALFDRWIPFPERPLGERPRKQAPGARTKPRREPRARAGSGMPERKLRGEPELPPRSVPPGPIFELRGGEPAPELVAALESQHLALGACPPVERSRAPQASSGRALRVLLRDKRALAGAIVLGEALGRRRPAPE